MHLCGQLELLKRQFVEIREKRYEEKRHENVVGPLVKRHCQLIELAKNIEDAFNINILLRLLIISVVIAASGIYLIQPFFQIFIVVYLIHFEMAYKHKIIISNNFAQER